MQSIEEFMTQFLADRAVIHRKELEQFVLFRKKYYTNDCWLGRMRQGKLEQILGEQETILRVSYSDTQPEAITVLTDGTNTLRMRYQLQAVADGWLIHSV